MPPTSLSPVTPKTMSAALSLIDRQLVDTINRFLAAHDMTPTQFGKLTMGDPALMPDLVAGRSPKVSTALFLTEWMQHHQRSPAAARLFAEQYRAARRARRANSESEGVAVRVCDECGVDSADMPGMICAGCHAYRDHTA